MPIHHAIWKVSPKPVGLVTGSLATELMLEEMIVAAPGILSSEWMLIGRQEQTGLGGRIDLLAIAPDASLVLIEIKRNRTPREVVAQSLDYASWVEQLTSEKIQAIFSRFSGGANLSEAFKASFGLPLDEESLNESHQIVLVASELDASTERIIDYLNARDIAINVLFFQVFQLGAEQLLSRAWMIDPGETQANVVSTSSSKGEKEPWNGEYYVSFGDESTRSWDDARRYGYISAGGGAWYSQTLRMLSEGDRVWVKIPATGYVGVGVVTAPVQHVKDFVVQTADGPRPALDVLIHASQYAARASDPEKSEYFVPVRWLDTVPREKAVNELGLFGNQNSVCRPETPKWRHTVARLKEVFQKWDAAVEGLTVSPGR